MSWGQVDLELEDELRDHQTETLGANYSSFRRPDQRK